jgi:hypothetical protein
MEHPSLAKTGGKKYNLSECSGREHMLLRKKEKKKSH